MNWQEVCEDKSLKDLPYKIETNRFGQIVMSPASNFHGYLQQQIGFLLETQKESGKTFSECSIDTNDGVKVADVIWCNDQFFNKFKFITPYPLAPQLCVEVISSSNTEKEMSLKMDLYFSQGAQEVWFCSLDGKLSYFTPLGEIKKSTLFPHFPDLIA